MCIRDRYYNGTVQKDILGNDVELGGSAVSNLADNAELFGLTPGSTNVFGIVYTCLLYTSPSPRDRTRSRMPSSA